LETTISGFFSEISREKRPISGIKAGLSPWKPDFPSISPTDLGGCFRGKRSNFGFPGFILRFQPGNSAFPGRKQKFPPSYPREEP
jgi:hypothetical protein